MAVKPSSLKSEVGIRARTLTQVVEESDRGDRAAEGNDEGDSAVEGSDEGDSAVEGSEEYFDESEHVDGFAAEERSSDCEEVDESEEDG